jgi:hypothetical protein
MENEFQTTQQKTINQFKGEITGLENYIADAQSRADKPGVLASAEDVLSAKYNLRNVNEQSKPELDRLKTEWVENGGERVETARNAANASRLNLSAEEIVSVNKERQNAEEAWGKAHDDRLSDTAEDNTPLSATDNTEPTDIEVDTGKDIMNEAQEQIAEVEPIATEAKDDRKENNAKDVDEPEKANKEQLESLSFRAGISRNTLAELVHNAFEINDKEQRELRTNAKGIRGIISKVAGTIKYSTLFKAETIRKTSEELMFAATRELDDNGQLTLEQWRNTLSNEGITFTESQEIAFLDNISEHLFSESEGVAFRGEGVNETPEMAQLRMGIKGCVLDFVVATGTNGLTDEQRKDNSEQYSNRISSVVNEFMDNHPDFNRERIEVYADSSRQLLEQSLATMRHDDGMDKLDKMLNEMRIDVGQRQLGAYNNINTEYIEKTMDLAKSHNLGTMIGKASFVTATWIGAGALTSGLAASAAQSGSKRVANIAGLVVGTAMAGPAGAAIGMAASIGVSAAWGRLLGRKRMSETADAAEVSIATAGNRGELGEQFRNLTTEVIPYNEAINDLKKFMELKPGVDNNSSEISDYQLRPNLSKEELIGTSEVIARLQSTIEAEDKYNLEAAIVAKKDRNRSGLSKLLASQANPDGRAINLFQAQDSNTWLKERSDMSRGINIVSQGLRDNYSDTIVDVVDNKNISLKDLLGTYLVERQIVAESEITDYQKYIQKIAEQNIADYRESVQIEIGNAGLRGGVVGAVIGSAAILGSAGFGEWISGGKANTIFDAFKSDLPSNVIKGVNADIVLANNIGSSGVKINGDTALFTNSSGNTIAATLGQNGELTQSAISELHQQGIEITQHVDKGSSSIESLSNYVKDVGATPHKIINWLNNGTQVSDGTKLGARLTRLPDGTIEFSQNGGIASGNGVSVDVIPAGQQGNVVARFVEGDSAVIRPGYLDGNHIVTKIGPNDPLQKLFTSGNNPRPLSDSIGFSVINKADMAQSMSISTVVGEGTKEILAETPGHAIIEVTNTTTPGFIGLAPLTGSSTNAILNDRQPETEPTNNPPQPIPIATNLPPPVVTPDNNQQQILPQTNTDSTSVIIGEDAKETIADTPEDIVVEGTNDTKPKSLSDIKAIDAKEITTNSPGSFLSQEEIDALLSGDEPPSTRATALDNDVSSYGGADGSEQKKQTNAPNPVGLGVQQFKINNKVYSDENISIMPKDMPSEGWIEIDPNSDNFIVTSYYGNRVTVLKSVIQELERRSLITTR